MEVSILSCDILSRDMLWFLLCIKRNYRKTRFVNYGSIFCHKGLYPNYFWLSYMSVPNFTLEKVSKLRGRIQTF